MTRGAKASAAELAAWSTMCSVLPTPGTTISLRVSHVELHPETPLARLWGLSGEWRELYARLRDDLQAAPGPRLASVPGGGGGAGGGGGLSVGDLCLVELGGRWLRCRVVGRLRGPGQDYRVFLLDEGRTVSAGPYYLARGREEFFHLPSEVLGCVLADLVPPGSLGAGEGQAAGGEPQQGPGAPRGSGSAFGWTAAAFEFFGCLHGKDVSGLVREVLIPQRLVVLELPWLLAQMHHLGLASQISPAAFRALLHASLGSSCLPPPEQALLPPPPPPPPPPQPPLPAASAAPPRGLSSPGSLDYFYPKLELNMTESVLVTEICDPHRIYCQLRSLSKEICRLSDAMNQAFEGAREEDLQETLPAPGSPCAARGIDGCWYRALLLEVYPGGSPEEQLGTVAQVICVDYGRKEFVTKRNLRRLPAECFRMPVVTYLCSLQGITDGGCGWTRSQISELKTLLLGKSLQAHIEAYCAFEHVYYVTFFGQEGFNLNCLFGVQAHCLTQRFVHRHQGHTSDLGAEQESIGAPAKKEPLGTLSRFTATSLPRVHLKAGECHKAQVSFLQDPTQFSVYLQEYHQPLCHLKQNLQDFYSQSKKLEGVLLEPQPGSLCCVMLKENSYHRAIVTSMQGEGIEVYLVDRGNTEIVDLYKVKELLPQFRELPAAALRCALANPSSPSQPWRPVSVDFFKKAVLNKELEMQVLGMQGDIYIVELFDHSLAGEKNLAKIMSQGKYAERHDSPVSEPIQKPLRKGAKEQGISQKPLRVTSAKEQSPSKPDHPSSAVKHQAVGSICSLPRKPVEKEDSKGITNNSPSLAQNYSETKPRLSCEGQLEVGSTVDVIVSYVESPSFFWCQLAKTSHDLKILMAEIQHFCAHVEQSHDWLNPVCLAKYSEDGRWYRALILQAAGPTEEVEVAYVDYGNKELVPLKNLRSTRAEFLQLKAQAFRCSLYNLIQPNSQDPFVWDEDATEAFQEFVDSASKMELKCTIFALAALDNTYLLNIVDLITPFESVCHFLTRKGFARSVEPQKPLTSRVHLLSYYYSTHDIKIGSEELVYVTHVQHLCLFYCQLARSTHVLEHLTNSIGKLSKVGHSLKSSLDPGNVYLAKFADGCWYRAILAQTSPTKEVFFVDYGNTEMLKKEDLISVPRDAYEILLLPMQAIKCSLSDIADVPKEAIARFEKLVLDKPLKAIIVAKEPDGKLIVELYNDKIQINAKLKEDFDLQGSKRISRPAEHKKSGCEGTWPCFTGVDHSTPEVKRHISKKLGPLDHSREAKPSQQKTKREMVIQSPLPVERRNEAGPVSGRSRHEGPLEKWEGTADSLGNRDQNEICTDSLPKKLCDLPLKNLSPGFKTFVYVSHINSLSDFYVQLVEDEPLLDSISEKLNQSEVVENLNGQQLHRGDLICTVFPEDSLWYRAVVQKQLSDELVSVQYIDYGNTTEVNICKTRRLPEDCALCPGLSIHCSLGGVKTRGLPEWTEEAVQCFSQSTSEIQMDCEFVEQLEGKWEVILCDGEGNVMADLVNSHNACKRSLSVETLDKNETEVDLMHLGNVISDEPSKPAGVQDTKSFFWKMPVGGQTVKAFARATKSPGDFWCQFADLYEISSIEKKVKDATKLAGCSTADIKIGCPCIAKCSKDEIFYRAIITSVLEDALIVVHVDYGTEDIVTREMLRQISDELLILPPQAFPCRLFGFNSSEGSWVEGTTDIFCNKIVNSLLDVTVMEILCNRPLEIPLFAVNLECQRENINAQMKPFWKTNSEDGGSGVANLHSHEGQNEDAKAEDLEVGQMKPFWNPNGEGSGSTVANLLSHEGQNKDAETENLEVVQMKPLWEPNKEDSVSAVANLLGHDGQNEDAKAEDLEVVQMKLFLEPNKEDDGSTVANLLSHEGQNEDAKAEDLEVMQIKSFWEPYEEDSGSAMANLSHEGQNKDANTEDLEVVRMKPFLEPSKEDSASTVANLLSHEGQNEDAKAENLEVMQIKSFGEPYEEDSGSAMANLSHEGQNKDANTEDLEVVQMKPFLEPSKEDSASTVANLLSHEGQNEDAKAENLEVMQIKSFWEPYEEDSGSAMANLSHEGQNKDAKAVDLEVMQVKPFWEPYEEDSGLALANLLSHEGQNKDAKVDDLGVVLCEVGTPTCTPVALKDTRASEDFLLACEPFQPTEECSALARNVGFCEMRGNEYPDRHHQITFEVLDTGKQQTVPEEPANELVCLALKKECDSKTAALSCTDVFENLFLTTMEREVTEQSPFEAQEEVKGWKTTSTQEAFDIELLLSAEKVSSENLVETESIDGNHLSCEEMGETSKLGLIEERWVEQELELNPFLMDEVNCGQERPLELPVLATPLLPAVENHELPVLPAVLPPSLTEIQSCLPESKLKLQAAFCMGEEKDLCEIRPDALKQNNIEQQAVQEKSSEQVESRPVTCSGFEEGDSKLADDESASWLQLGEQAETSVQSVEKNETPCELKEFDVGSKCMVGTDAQGYEAEILDVSDEGTEVCDGMGTPVDLSESSSAVEAVEEETGDSENNADPLGLSDQQP